MQKLGDSILLSASDLVGHLNCRHLTGLDIAVATGALKKPKVWDPLLEILWERGARHEQRLCRAPEIPRASPSRSLTVSESTTKRSRARGTP